jgi:hypothetical protein
MPPTEVGTPHQPTLSAKIHKDNRHTRHVVRQYAAIVRNTMSHACSCLPLAYKRRR